MELALATADVCELLGQPKVTAPGSVRAIALETKSDSNKVLEGWCPRCLFPPAGSQNHPPITPSPQTPSTHLTQAK